jgi:hypothetical protein
MSNQIKKTSILTMQWKLFLLGLFKIPIIGFTRPKLISIDDKNVVVKIKLNRRTKNHLNSMYFGALAVGADIAGGIHVFYFSEILNKKISFSFKGMKAEFVKRAESDVYFSSNEGQIIKEAINESIQSGGRINKTIIVRAKNESGEIVATFEMITSLKVLI